MSSYTMSTVLLALISCLLLISPDPASGRILKKCDAVKELERNKAVAKSLIGHYTCLMQYESKFNTSLVRGPGSLASYSYGVFQITSDKWCSRYRPGGVCNKKCDDFANDDIQDDIVCAATIVGQAGLQHWPSWVKNCKGKFPSYNECKKSKNDEKADKNDGDLFDGSDEDIDESDEELGDDNNDESNGSSSESSERVNDKAYDNSLMDKIAALLRKLKEAARLKPNIVKPLQPKLMTNDEKHAIRDAEDMP